MSEKKIKKIRKKIHEDLTIFHGKTPLWKRITLWIILGILLLDIILKYVV